MPSIDFALWRTAAADLSARDWLRGLAMVGCVAALVVVLADPFGWRNDLPERFPAGRSGELVIEVPDRLDQMLPRLRSAEPVESAGLVVGQPAVVPGLERVAWARSPTMTADLRAIYYVAFNPASDSEDVFGAVRGSPSEPFAPPQPIAALAGPATESHVSVSGDGLRLAALRQGEPGVVVCERPARDDAFRLPSTAPLPPEIADADGRDWSATTVQMLGRSQAVVRLRDAEPTRSQYRLFRIAVPAFGPPTLTPDVPVLLPNPWPAYAFSSDLRRTYFASQEGLMVTARANRRSQFVTPAKVSSWGHAAADPTRFDSSLWIDPSESVCLYASRPPDPSRADDNLLWLLRFR